MLDQLRAVDAAGHDQVGEDQVYAAAAEGFQSLGAGGAGDDAVAARFQKNFANGKILFVVVDAENRFFGFHDVTGRAVTKTLSLYLGELGAQ